MKRAASLVLLLTAIVALNACAKVSETQCRQGDWYGMGYRDGSRGAGNRLTEDDMLITNYTETCGKFGVVPDAAAFNNGYRKGIEYFCHPAQAFQSGSTGGTYYAGVCPADLQAAYSRAYDDGEDLLREKQSLTAQEAVIDNLSAQIDQVRADVAAAEAILISSTSDATARYNAQARIDTAPQAIAILERDLREERVKLASMRKTHEAKYQRDRARFINK